jgi:hypothetical protein
MSVTQGEDKRIVATTRVIKRGDRINFDCPMYLYMSKTIPIITT